MGTGNALGLHHKSRGWAKIYKGLKDYHMSEGMVPSRVMPTSHYVSTTNHSHVDIFLHPNNLETTVKTASAILRKIDPTFVMSSTSVVKADPTGTYMHFSNTLHRHGLYGMHIEFYFLLTVDETVLDQMGHRINGGSKIHFDSIRGLTTTELAVLLVGSP
jgi:hypothetical protein